MENYNIAMSMLFIGIGVGKLDSGIDNWRALIFILIGLTLLITYEIRKKD